MQSVTILTTHGRRKTLKVDNNKTVLSILEKVCSEFKFDPNSHGLKFHNKLLDLDQMFRFAAIPNNATLEMVEIDKKRSEETNLLICLQLEDGTRLEGKFSSNSVLRSVINDLCPSKSAEEFSPVIVYMRSNYYAEQLDNLTLKDLGLSGRALLRLMNTDPESLKVQANISAPLPQKPREEKFEQKAEKMKSTTTSIGFSDIKKLKEETESKVESTEEPMEEGEEPVAKPLTEQMTEAPSDHKVQNVALEEAMQIPEPEPIINYLDEAGTIIFSLDTLQKSITSDVPDSFFELTESDVKKLYRDLKNDVEHGENKPLMTSALRKLEEEKKVLNLLAKYKWTAIRIQLPDRNVIQTKFSKVDTIGTVMKLVRGYLADPNLSCHLYVTPPKTILNPEDTLVEAKLVPSALLHLGLDEPSAIDQQASFLNPLFLDKLSTGCSPSSVFRVDSDKDQSESNAGTSNVNARKSGSSSLAQLNFLPSKEKPNTLSGAVPKWFKR